MSGEIIEGYSFGFGCVSEGMMKACGAGVEVS